MSTELLALAVVVAGAAAVPLGRWLPREPLRRWAAVACAAFVAAAGVLTIALRRPPVAEADVQGRPIEVPAAGYVSSNKCRACHPHEHATWHDSYHRSMTQRAGPEAVLGDFDDVTLSIDGKDYHLSRDGDEYWVELEDPLSTQRPPPRVRRRLAMTTGSHNMQAYWYEAGHTRNIAMLPFTWLVAEGRWISRRAAFVGPESDPVDAKINVWSTICLKCHVTHGRPRIKYRGNQQLGLFTEVAEFGVSCEACHGPGEEHVAANQNPLRRYRLRATGEPDPTIVNPARLDPERSTQVCGACHAAHDYRFNERTLNEWFRDGFRFRPGEDLSRYRDLDHEGDEQFWPDGLIRVAGREYNSLDGSPCYEQGGMSCLSCHQLHQPADDPRPRAAWADDQLVDLDGDRMCLQCHASYGDDVAAHTHHAPESAGSRCQNCHMPHTTYGLMKGVRNHRIASPRALVTQATGRPNACNQCHLDKPLLWTAERLRDWYGHEVPELADDERTIAAGVVQALKGDAAQRALVAWNLGWPRMHEVAGRAWTVPLLAELLDDPYEVVRLIAARSLRAQPGWQDFDHELTGSPDGPKRAKAAALARWSQAGGGAQVAPARRSATLFDEAGALREDVFRHLLRRRDRRVIRLFE